LIASGLARTAHDVSLGGLAIALAEMAITSKIGIRLDPVNVSPRRDTYWFGERSGSIVIACESERVNDVTTQLETGSVPWTRLGVALGDAIAFSPMDSLGLSAARSRWESALLSDRPSGG
jgi:phosphoribosylformylglycinamidine (FGAM) synthase-like enzyme